MSDLPIIERRRIEAQILKNVHDVIEARQGQAEADAIIGEAVTQSAIQQGKEFAARLDHAPDLQDFADILPNWTKGGSLEIETLHASAERLDFNVTRCRYAEMYREMGLADLGAVLSCNRDGAFCEGYDPRLKLERTQTIMQGASHCNFHYTYEK